MIACRWALGAATAALLVLSACGDKVQTLDASAKKADAQPWSVSDVATPAFAAPGWKAGDKVSWEEQIRKRNQSQNDYVR